MRFLILAAAGEDGARGAIGTEIIGALDREDRPVGARTVDPALDRADGAAADLRRFLVGEAGGADQDQGLALVGGQLSSALRNSSNSRWLF